MTRKILSARNYRAIVKHYAENVIERLNDEYADYNLETVFNEGRLAKIIYHEAVHSEIPEEPDRDIPEFLYGEQVAYGTIFSESRSIAFNASLVQSDINSYSGNDRYGRVNAPINRLNWQWFANTKKLEGTDLPEGSDIHEDYITSDHPESAIEDIARGVLLARVNNFVIAHYRRVEREDAPVDEIWF